MTPSDFSAKPLQHPSALLRMILVETSHPGNVGSAARAMKTMGFDDLRLVRPKRSAMASEPEAIALASGAQDVLLASQESADLATAVGGCSLVLGLTSRDREFGPPAIGWAEARERLAQCLIEGRPVALMFGPERTGLDNAHLALCTHRVWLDANPDYPSLNLAQAVMVCAFTARESLLTQLTHEPESRATERTQVDLADPAAVAAMLLHLGQGLEAIGYLDPANPKKLMARLGALFARAELHTEEIDLLRGIAKQMLLRK